MKPRKRLNLLKQVTLQRGLQRDALLDAVPGTKFDNQIQHISEILTAHRNFVGPFETRDLPWMTGEMDVIPWEHPPAIMMFMERIGYDFARAVEKRDSDWFRDFAKAVDAWKAHKPQPDRLLVELKRYCGENRTYTVRELKLHLKSVGVDAYDKQIRRACGILRRRISGKAGNPNWDTKRAKKRR